MTDILGNSEINRVTEKKRRGTINGEVETECVCVKMLIFNTNIKFFLL